MNLELTPSQENYLEHIWHLSSQGSVRLVDLADSVGVKRPSVSRAITVLASMGLVKHERYGRIEFTQKGYQTAQYIVRRDQSLKRFLTLVLHLEPKKIEEEVCRMEHAISSELLTRIEVLEAYINTHAEVQKELSQEMKRSTQPKIKAKTVNIGARPHV